MLLCITTLASSNPIESNNQRENTFKSEPYDSLFCLRQENPITLKIPTLTFSFTKKKVNNPRNNSWCFFCFEAADLNCARLLFLEVFVIGKVGHWPHSCWSRPALKNAVTEVVAVAKTTLLINTIASKLRMLFLVDNWHYCAGSRANIYNSTI